MNFVGRIRIKWKQSFSYSRAIASFDCLYQFKLNFSTPAERSSLIFCLVFTLFGFAMNSMVRLGVLALVTHFLIIVATAVNTKNRVSSLPGYPGPLPSANIYTGFVNVDDTSDSNLFYMLVEAEEDAANKPLIWWMNGGPGASSFAGLFGENGPLLLTEDGALMKNPYAWNTLANVLYVEFAPGIGFSYCANSSNPNSACPQNSTDCSPCIASDSSVVSQNLAFLTAFLQGTGPEPPLFPEYQGRPLYIAGESYAGVYIPTLSLAILNAFQDTKIVNLNGLWVTDPCTDNKAQSGWLDLGVQFAYEKSLISKTIHDTLILSCSNGHTKVGDLIRKTDSRACKNAWRLYDIALAGIGDAVHASPIYDLPMYVDPLNAYGPSGGPDMPGYIGRADVRAALHASASPNKVYHMELGNNGYPQYTLEYAACNDNADSSMKSMIDVWGDIITLNRKGVASAQNLHTCIISSGDIDPVVGLHGTEKAVDSLGFTEMVGGNRRPWFFNSTGTDMKTLMNKPTAWGQTLHARNAGPQVGGFHRNFDTDSTVGLSFVSVRSAGHMTPAYTPHRVLHVIARGLLQGKLLSPLLPRDFDTVEDDLFYGNSEKRTTGEFVAWVRTSMGGDYINA